MAIPNPRGLAVHVLAALRRPTQSTPEVDWRIPIGLAVAFVFAWISTRSSHASYLRWWFRLGITPNHQPFADARAVTSGWECVRRGVDVVAHNPCDPFGRAMQYPKVWMMPALLGLGQGLTVPLGLSIAVMVVITALMAFGPMTRPLEAAFYFLLLLSPPIALLIERGNVDGLVFALVVFGVIAWMRRRPVSRGVGLALVLLAAVLKLYPFVVGWALLRRIDRRSIAVLLGAGLLFGAYLLATAGDISKIAGGTMFDVLSSFGMEDLVAAVVHPGVHHLANVIALQNSSEDTLLRDVGALIMVTVAAGLAWLLRGSDLDGRTKPASAPQVELFIAGASIYVVSFLAFLNWDYRMIFLLTAVPQLLTWSRASCHRLRLIARSAVAAVLVAFLAARFSLDARWFYNADQAAKGLVCLLLLGLLVAEAMARVRHLRIDRAAPGGTERSGPPTRTA